MRVYLHYHFIMGNNDAKNITDYRFFNLTEKNKFESLLLNLLNNKGIFCGANKKSSNHIKANIRNLSEKFNIHHYHFADDCIHESCAKINVCKNFLTLKNYTTKSEVLHYLYNVEEDFIVFFGYSRVHDNLNFPSLNTRPMVDRLSFSKTVRFDSFEFLNYIELSEVLNLELLPSNFQYLRSLLDISSFTWLQLKKGTREFEIIKLFYEFIVYSCLQLNIEKSTLEKQDLTKLYLVIINKLNQVS